MAKKAVKSVGEALTQTNPIEEDDDTVDILLKVIGGILLFSVGYAIGHSIGCHKQPTVYVLK